MSFAQDAVFNATRQYLQLIFSPGRSSDKVHPRSAHKSNSFGVLAVQLRADRVDMCAHIDTVCIVRQ